MNSIIKYAFVSIVSSVLVLTLQNLIQPTIKKETNQSNDKNNLVPVISVTPIATTKTNSEPLPTLVNVPLPTTSPVQNTEQIKNVKPTSSIIQKKPLTAGDYFCNCSKSCKNLSCNEAQYQLNVCGCTQRDADNDGIACDSQCQ